MPVDGWYLVGATGDEVLRLVGACCVGEDEPEWSRDLFSHACATVDFSANEVALSCNNCVGAWYALNGRTEFTHTPRRDQRERVSWTLAGARLYPDQPTDDTIGSPYCEEGRLTVIVR